MSIVVERYLVVGSKKVNNWSKARRKPQARLSVGVPALKSHEVAVKLHLELPEELFDRPQLQASIRVPDGAVAPTVIDTEVLDNIEEVIRREAGLDLTISLVSEDESTK